VFLTQSHCKQTQGSDLHVGVSIDQIFARSTGRNTPIPVDAAVHRNTWIRREELLLRLSVRLTDSISWSSPEQPLPMIRDPRVVFDQLFGVGGDPSDRKERAPRIGAFLDWLGTSIARMKKDSGRRTAARLNDYSTTCARSSGGFRMIEARNLSGEPARAAGRAGRRAGFVPPSTSS
jgi:hypothetical protein